VPSLAGDRVSGVRGLRPGDPFPDLELADQDGHRRSLGELAGGDPLLLHTYRGWWCPKERTWFRQHLVALQEDAEVAYTRFASLSVDPPAVSAAFRAGLDARWPFLCDPGGETVRELGLQETTDSVHHPYLPTVWLLTPDLRVHRWWLGYWYWGRPTASELHAELRTLTTSIRADWDPPPPEPS
jgi:peroxiredoxin